MASPSQVAYSIDLGKEGARLDGSDDTDVWDRAYAKAVDFILSKQLTAEIFIPPGTLGIRRPLIIPTPKLSIAGSGKYGSYINFISGVTGHQLIVAADRSSGSSALQYTSAVAGGTSLVQGITGGNQAVLDLTQYNQCRLNGDWTINYTYGNVSRLPTSGEFLLLIFGVGGQLYTAQSMYSSAVTIDCGTTGNLTMRFRYGGTILSLPISTASHTALVPGQTNNFEFSWDNTAKELRFFWNGELWTRNGYVPPVGDGSGFIHYPWERLTLGSGLTFTLGNDQAGNYYLPAAIKGFHLSNGVRHRVNFTPSFGNAIPDNQTRIAVNFDRTYKGCVIATGAANYDVYLYPFCTNCPELPQMQLKDFGMVGGSGVRIEFASQMYAANLFHLYPGDGWQIVRNGYFSQFNNIDVVAGTGRAAWLMNGSSYCELIGIRAAGPIGFFLDGVNVEGMNLTASIHPGYFAGMVMNSGTSRIHYQVDAEEANPSFLAALIVESPEAVNFDSCTLYGPPGLTGAPSVIASMADPKARIKFDTCTFYQDPSAPLIKRVGVLSSLPHPIVLDTCKNAFDAPLCNVPGDVIER